MVTSYNQTWFLRGFRPRTEKQMAPLESWGHSVSETGLFFKIKHFKIWNFWHDLDLTLQLGSPKWTRIARRPSPLYSTCKIAHKTCATPLIFVFYVRWPFVTWSWLWTELNIKDLLNQCLTLYFRSTRSKFWPETDNFEVSTARNPKAPSLTFDLTLTWHVTSFGKFRGCFRIVSSRAFERHIGRLSEAVCSRVMTWGLLTPPRSKSRVAKYPSKCRGKEWQRNVIKWLQ